jgi:hypothetical protein
MSQYWDAGRVKSTLSELFNELGYVKSANLAGEMVTRHWGESRGDNYDQRALSVLVTSAMTLYNPFDNENERLTYLWCHQKIHKKRGWFFSIATSRDDISAAFSWYMQKAEG